MLTNYQIVRYWPPYIRSHIMQRWSRQSILLPALEIVSGLARNPGVSGRESRQSLPFTSFEPNLAIVQVLTNAYFSREGACRFYQVFYQERRHNTVIDYISGPSMGACLIQTSHTCQIFPNCTPQGSYILDDLQVWCSTLCSGMRQLRIDQWRLKLLFDYD